MAITMKQYITILIICIGLTTFPGYCQPASMLLTSSGDGGSSVSSDATFGYDFTVGATSLEVLALGLYDQDLDGFFEAHDVSLWTQSGTLLGRVTIPSGSLTPLDGEFRYIQLSTPVTLAARQSYVLGAFYPTTADWFIVDSPDQANAIFSPLAVFGGTASIGGSGFPVLSGPDLFAGPNMEFTATPEPSSLMLAVAGALVVLAFNALKHRSSLRIVRR